MRRFLEPYFKIIVRTHWSQMIKHLTSVLHQNAPKDFSLVKQKELSESAPDFRGVSKNGGVWDIQKYTSLVGIFRNRNYLISMITDQIITQAYAYLQTQHLLDIMDSMLECFNYAKSINTHARLQKELMMEVQDTVLSDLINLQEQVSLSCYLKCLFRFYSETQYDVDTRVQIAEKHLLRTCFDAVKSYMEGIRKLSFISRSLSMDINPVPSKEEIWLKRLTHSKIPLIILILDNFSQLSTNLLSSKISFVYPMCCDLTVSDNFLLRKSLRDLFLRLGSIKIQQFRYEVVKI